MATTANETILTPMAHNLPLPVLFHPLKHHLNYIREFVKSDLSDPASIKASLLTLGNSNPDVYTGHLSTKHIAKEIILYLQQQNILEPAAYQTYLNADCTDYKTIILSDGSAWVLRWGVATGRHVHIHPARHTKHTFRAKATILKTAIASILESRISGATIDLQLINHARKVWLNLAPIATLQPGLGAAKLIELIHAT